MKFFIVLNIIIICGNEILRAAPSIAILVSFALGIMYGKSNKKFLDF
jgi:hypothetical protein